MNDFINQVGFHEFAHQWWGHLVGQYQGWPDANFIAIEGQMKDSTSTYGGKSATTPTSREWWSGTWAPTLNATGDGKMDWFFNSGSTAWACPVTCQT